MADSNSERVRVWVGTFRSRRQKANYFCPPTNNPHGPPSQFETDQGVLVVDTWTWSEFRDEGPTEDLRDLIDGCDEAEFFLNQACDAFARSGIGPINTVYLAFQNQVPNPKPVEGDGYRLHVLGEFTYERPADYTGGDDEDEEKDEVGVAASAEEIDLSTAEVVAGKGPMDEERFWDMIERAWEAVPDALALRRRFLRTRSLDMAEELQFRYCSMAVAVLEAAVRTLSKRNLVQFDRILEQRLHDLDRPDIHKHTGGSNDGFLYCRGFVVALGRKYYDTVNADPKKAAENAECEEICMCAVREYVNRYDQPPPPSKISRESFSNGAHWK